jgi:hypothetical protein
MNSIPSPETSFPIGLDPRRLPGFVASLFPLANGAPPSASADPRNDEVVMAFLLAYYEINLRWKALRAVRDRAGERDVLQEERAALQAIEAALRQRDELEDRYAPYGIIAEPIMEDGFARDIQFTFGSVNAAGRFRAEPIVSSATLSFQVPEKRRRSGVKPPGPPPTNAVTQFPCAD